MSDRTYIVAQLGARMHYAVPKILQESGQLEKLYTDICAVKGWPRMLSLIPNFMRPLTVTRLLSRIPHGINPNSIVAFNQFGYAYAKRRNLVAKEGRFSVHLWAGKEFCHCILNEGFGRAGGVLTFNSAGLEILKRAKQEGLQAVTEQTIAPMRMELALLDDESKQFPGWESSSNQTGAADYCDREEDEWKSADLILCGSEFVRDGIQHCGGPVEKCVVVPYGVDVPVQNIQSRKLKAEIRNRPLRVLTVGTIGLRKGSPYVLEAAKLMKGRAVFRMVGSIGVTHQVERQLRDHLELTGPVPRSKIANHFEWADVFLLPSLCEGSATVTYEALARGLPVICTPNTGSVVRDSLEGFIVPVRDADSIVKHLETIISQPELKARLSLNAANRANDFTVKAYGTRLVAAIAAESPSRKFN
jgi:hypothetical protein